MLVLLLLSGLMASLVATALLRRQTRHEHRASPPNPPPVKLHRALGRSQLQARRAPIIHCELNAILSTTLLHRPRVSQASGVTQRARLLGYVLGFCVLGLWASVSIAAFDMAIAQARACAEDTMRPRVRACVCVADIRRLRHGHRAVCVADMRPRACVRVVFV